MCGYADVETKKGEVSLYLGYYGGSVTIGDVKYEQGGSEESKAKMKEALKTYTKNQLIDLIVGFADEAEEG
ncbi:hypothetical protein KAR91_41860 [Candidatus Pacearchaeota archaeon]|nr:hypothetical protein [Candidatus Pacearchaeota archaeon]